MILTKMLEVLSLIALFIISYGAMYLLDKWARRDMWYDGEHDCW
jgi:hypothetical protein